MFPELSLFNRISCLSCSSLECISLGFIPFCCFVVVVGFSKPISSSKSVWDFLKKGLREMVNEA